MSSFLSCFATKKKKASLSSDASLSSSTTSSLEETKISTSSSTPDRDDVSSPFTARRIAINAALAVYLRGLDINPCHPQPLPQRDPPASSHQGDHHQDSQQQSTPQAQTSPLVSMGGRAEGLHALAEFWYFSTFLSLPPLLKRHKGVGF